MIRHPRRIVLGGLIVGAVGFASFALRPGMHFFPGHQPGGEQRGASVFGAPVNGAITAPPVALNSIDPTSDSSVAQILRAVHDSLQRNDLAAAKVLLDAVKNYHKDDEQATSLQKRLPVRQESVVSAFPAGSIDKPQKTSDTPRRYQRPAPRSAARSGPHKVLPAAQARSRVVPRYFQPTVVNEGTKPSDKVVRDAAATFIPTPDVSPQKPQAKVVQPSLGAIPAAAQEMAPATDIAEKTSGQPLATLGQKTREDVRAELVRARSDGSLPRFGNPDPAGPGVKTISSSP